MAAEGQRVLVNLGCGPAGEERLPQALRPWRQVRVDIDPAARPDVLASLTDLSAFGSGSVDGVWAAHCIEHLYLHDVVKALAEIERILAPDGFACIIVPDLQRAAELIAADRMHETVYVSPAGPITPHDMVFGHGQAIARGATSMAHRCGFTPSVLVQALATARFAESAVFRRASLEIAAVACKTKWASDQDRDALVERLGL